MHSVTIAYSAPGLRDAVRHMETGVPVEPGSIEELSRAITRLLEDDDLRREMPGKALRYAKTFS